VAQDPEGLENLDSEFGVSDSRELTLWICDPRNPEGDIAAWDPGSEWSPGGIESGDRHLGARGLER
jgi:hypothetical protein